MAMKQVMSKEQAIAHAAKLAHAYEKFGAQISVPYTTAQLLEVVAVLHAHGNYDAPTTDDLTLVKRQLTACKAREAGLRKRLSDLDDRPDDEDAATVPPEAADDAVYAL
jgi:hypothetical protein